MTMEFQSSNGISITWFLHLSFRKHLRRGNWKTKNKRTGEEGCSERVPSAMLYPWTQNNMAACTRSVQDYTSQHSSMDGGSAHKASNPTWRATGTWQLLKEERLGFYCDELCDRSLYNLVAYRQHQLDSVGYYVYIHIWRRGHEFGMGAWEELESEVEVINMIKVLYTQVWNSHKIKFQQSGKGDLNFKQECIYNTPRMVLQISLQCKKQNWLMSKGQWNCTLLWVIFLTWQ